MATGLFANVTLHLYERICQSKLFDEELDKSNAFMISYSMR